MFYHNNAATALDLYFVNTFVKPFPVFPCNQCGLCCKHVHLATETQFLDRGDGTCKHYDETSKLCSIYSERPNICRVDRLYLMRYAQLYTWEEYVALNVQACTVLAQNYVG